MILNSTKFGGNQTTDVEVGLDRRTDRQTDRPIPIYPPQTMPVGGIMKTWPYKMVASPEEDNLIVFYYLLASEIWPHQKGGLW